MSRRLVPLVLILLMTPLLTPTPQPPSMRLGSVATAAPASARWATPFPRPLEVLHPFAAPATPYGPGHRGVDLGAPAGAPVGAPAAGIVRFAGPVAGRLVVSLDANGLRFSYEPVAPAVRAGQRVDAGTPLGSLLPGHPGCPAAPGRACLHWGVRRGSTYLDPLRPVRTAVRLLPLGTAVGAPASSYSIDSTATLRSASRSGSLSDFALRSASLSDFALRSASLSDFALRSASLSAHTSATSAT